MVKSWGKGSSFWYGYKPNVTIVRMYYLWQMIHSAIFYNCLPIRIYFVSYYYFVPL